MMWRILFTVSSLFLWTITFLVVLYGAANPVFGLLALVGVVLSFFIFSKKKVIVVGVLTFGLISCWLPLVECYHSLLNALVLRELTGSRGDWWNACMSGVLILVLLISGWFILDLKVPPNASAGGED